MGDAPFSLACRSFHLPKQGCTREEYEDAFAGRPAAGRFAVADGASESAFAGIWARILVRTFVRVPGPWSKWLPAARKRWRSQLEGQELPWYAETKFQEGAFAALLGIAFEAGGWKAEAVGDCCLFHMREGYLRRAFPVRRARDFSSRPPLLGSRGGIRARPPSRRARVQGDWQPHDVLYLMSDALAEWFLKQVENRGQPWKDLREIQEPSHFVNWVADLRQAGALRNDDVTLVRVGEKKGNQNG